MTNSIFTDTQGLRPRRRAYNMSYRNDYTCALGELVPVYWQNLIPNSSIKISTHGLIRLTPLIAPVMDNIDYYIHFWQSPERTLKGELFTDFITGKLPMEEYENKYFVPVTLSDKLWELINAAYPGKDEELRMAFVARLLGNSSLMDMLGYDYSLFDESSEMVIQCNKLIMYVQLLVHWYVNENVLPWATFLDDSEWATDTDIQGDCSEAIATWIFNMYNKFGKNRFMTHAWPKDYFTSALPTLQFGGPTYLPLGDTAPVTITDGMQLHAPAGGAIQAELAHMVEEPFLSYPLRVAGDGQGVANLRSIDPETPGSVNNVVKISAESVTNDQGGEVVGLADLSEATAITVNEFRITNALQVFKEREMRYGRRAPEYYKGFYGVTPGDLRLQLPKFIGGGRLPINIADIEQTSQSTESSPQGNLAGKGTALGGGFAHASTFAPEETLILGLAWAMPKVTYSQLLSRHDIKINDRFLYFNPSFVHIGEQEVFNYELFAVADLNGPYKEFGYQPRYTEYRFHANECHGDFKGSLSFWTLSRIFESQPALNAEFIYMQPEALSRIFAVQKDTHGHVVNNMLCSLKFQVSLIQPLSRYGTPSLIV